MSRTKNNGGDLFLYALQRKETNLYWQQRWRDILQQWETLHQGCNNFTVSLQPECCIILCHILPVYDEYCFWHHGSKWWSHDTERELWVCISTQWDLINTQTPHNFCPKNIKCLYCFSNLYGYLLKLNLVVCCTPTAMKFDVIFFLQTNFNFTSLFFLVNVGLLLQTGCYSYYSSMVGKQNQKFKQMEL